MKNPAQLVVRAMWDEEAKVWVASSDEVPGLATEAASLDDLVPKLRAMIPELLDANGCKTVDDAYFNIVGTIKKIACVNAP